MEWKTWITWWIIFSMRYSRLFWIYLKKQETITDNPSVRVCINKIGNRITFKIKTGYHLELLSLETMKVLESTKNEITKDENSENVPRLEINEIVLIHCNIVCIDYQQDLRALYLFFPNKSFGQSLDISSKILIFL